MGPSNDNYVSNYDQQRRVVKATVLSIIAIVVLLVGGLMIWYASTHGRVVTDYEGGGGFTLQSTNDEQQVQETIVKRGVTTVRSGNYILRFKNGQNESLKYIEVPNFLRSVKANIANTGERLVERVAIGVLGNVMKTPTGIASVDNIIVPGNTFLHKTGDPSGIDRVTGNIPVTSFTNFVHNNIYTGFTASTDSGRVQIQRYDFGSLKLDTIPKVYEDNQDTSFVTPTTAQSNIFGISYTENDMVSVDVYDGTKLVHQLKRLKDIAKGEDDRRTISITSKYLATGTGGDFLLGEDENTSDDINGRPKIKEYVVKIYAIGQTNKVMKEIKIGKTNTVSSIQLNNDGTYLSVVDGQSLRIFNVDNGDEVFSYNSTSIIDPQWVSGAQLIFGSVESGLFQLDARDRSAGSLFSPNGSMNLSAFDVFDNKVYFSAFSLSESANNRSVPDGYILYLDKDAVEGNQLVKNTPNENSQVRITSLDNTIYAVSAGVSYGGDAGFTEIEPDTLFKDQVSAFLALKLTKPEQYKIIYGTQF